MFASYILDKTQHNFLRTKHYDQKILVNCTVTLSKKEHRQIVCKSICFNDQTNLLALRNYTVTNYLKLSHLLNGGQDMPYQSETMTLLHNLTF